MQELRKDPLTGRWAAVLEPSLPPGAYGTANTVQAGGDSCIFCPGREAETGPEVASIYPGGGAGWLVRAVPAPEPVFEPRGDLGRKGDGIYDKMHAVGAHEIIIESPEHGRNPEDIGPEHMRRVLDMYRMRIVEFEKDPRIRYVLITKNSGNTHGRALSHPHSFVLAAPIIPQSIKTELDGAKSFYAYKERCIFCDIMEQELKAGVRIISETKSFVVFCPFAPRGPFEFWLIPKTHRCAFHEMDGGEMDDLSHALTISLKKMRTVLKEPPYSIVLHTAPNRIPRRNHWHTLGDDYHWHIEVLPYLPEPAGFEPSHMFPLLTTSPEDAAKYIREA